MPYLLLTLLLVLLPSTEIAAQRAEHSPERAVKAVFEKANLMAVLSGQNWRLGLNLAAAYLPVGQSISIDITLSKGTEYVFIASGAMEQSDVDLYLRDAAGALLAEDAQNDGTPVIEFTAPAAGTFRLQLHLAAGTHPEAYVALSILQRQGVQISELNFRQVSKGFFGAANEIRSSEVNTDWQKRTGEWCLFGYLVQENRGVTLRGLSPGAGPRVFAAASGPEARETTLHLATKAGYIVAATEAPAAYPLLEYDCPAGETLELRVGTERSKSSSFILVGVFAQ